MFTTGIPKYAYSAVDGEPETQSEQDKDHALEAYHNRIRQHLLRSLILLLVAAVLGFLGFLFGQRAAEVHRVEEKLEIPVMGMRIELATDAGLSHIVDTVAKSFIYNRTFAEAPSALSDAAWESIFPPHGGFFHDASIASEGARLAVYHQLHCLDGIRHAYWALYDAAVQGSKVELEELPDYSTPWHTRHCIDFLRQMLMCNADTAIERNVPTIGGIRGFEVEHQCRRWDQLHAWVVERQTVRNGRPKQVRMNKD